MRKKCTLVPLFETLLDKIIKAETDQTIQARAIIINMSNAVI